MKVMIAGLGLIGGSFALALRDHALAEEILGVERSPEHAAEALRLGLADRMVTFEEGMDEADLVVLAVPVDVLPLMAVKALNRAGKEQVVMDMGSTKGELCEAVSMHARRGRFVAVHPMWGTEYSGPKAACHGAFRGCNVVLCDTERSNADALACVEGIFRNLECRLLRMNSEEHDLHAAYVSHISHVTSFALALTVLEKEREERHHLRPGGRRIRKHRAAGQKRRFDLGAHPAGQQVQRAGCPARAHPSAGDHAPDDRARRRRGADLRHGARELHRTHPAMTTAETGAAGERAAAEWLREEGYAIHAVNWRSGRYELDLVAERDGILHIVEVKTRRSGSLTPPEAAATRRKFHALTWAATHYLGVSGWRGEVQFDLLAAERHDDGRITLELIENAFESNW